MKDRRTESQRRSTAGAAPAGDRLDRLLGGSRDADTAAVIAGRGEPTAAPEGLIERALARGREAMKRAAIEEQVAPALVRRLLEQPAGRRLTMVRSSWQYRSPAVIRRLAAASRRLLGSDTDEAIGVARLAVESADRLDPAVYGEALRLDLAGRARVDLALAVRKQSRFREADELLAEGERLLREGSRDPHDLAWLCEVRGGLRSRQRRFEEALTEFRRAVRLHRRSGRPDLVGRVVGRLSRCASEANEPEKDVAILAAALEIADSVENGRQALVLAHNLLEALVEVGEWRRAVSVLREAAPVYEAFASPNDQLAFRWTQARIYANAGRPEAAAPVFRSARDGFLRAGLAVDAALCSLDWALLELQRRHPARVAEIAAELVPIFDSRQLTRESVAALGLFRQAAKEGAATASLIQTVAQVLQSRRAAGE